ncbi:MAG: hypothetical protein DRO06_04320, partial [Thermoproteota archaeon]
HNMPWPPLWREEAAALRILRREGRLPIRVRAYSPPWAPPLLRRGRGDPMLRFVGVKLMADGSLGARTAALREPYSDDPGNSGRMILSERAIRLVCRLAELAGLQAAVHAIGDGALEAVLRAFSGLRRPRAHRVEHASVAPPDLIEEAARLGCWVVVQPRFVVSDFWVGERLGERARWAYPFRSMLEAGVRLAASSDCPVEPLDPLSGIRAAVDRPGPEAISEGEAVSLYTSSAAAVTGEADRGVLRPGAAADLTVLSSLPAGRARVEATIVASRVAFDGAGIFRGRLPDGICGSR